MAEDMKQMTQSHRADDADREAQTHRGPERAVAFARFQGRTRAVARLGWWCLVGVVVAMVLLSIPPSLELLRSVCPQDPCLDHRLTLAELQSLTAVGMSLQRYSVFLLTANLVPPVVYLAVAFVLFFRKPDDGMAYFTSLTLVLFGGVTYPDLVKLLAATNAVWTIPFVVLNYLGGVCIIALFFVFPTGVFIPRWTRFVLLFWMFAQVFDVVSGPPLEWNLVSERLTNAPLVLVLVAVLYAQIYRYRHVSNAIQRRQTKWVVFGTVAALTVILILGLIILFDIASSDNAALALFLNTLFVLSATLIPISIGIAILRSNLYDIDFIINRTLVYGALTAILAGVMAVSSDLTKRAFLALTGQSSDLAPIVATLIVVAAFDPVKKRVQAVVDSHFKYPTRSFGEFGAKLRDFVGMSDPRTLVTRFLGEAVPKFDAGSGAVYLGQGQGAQLDLIHQIGAADDLPGLTIPIEHDGRQVGLLTLGTRRNGDAYDEEDRRSLEQMGDLVAQSILRTGRQV